MTQTKEQIAAMFDQGIVDSDEDDPSDDLSQE